ncbi:hypothetical protein JHD48_05555 [Sulfurimonas sp. SAG-AH-194-I05]|nr:hypothetical protein [Sulfurimonas sp. SAG-AH-194-I05]MDF1875192.1 hypothetical protein [Sulfurimonas sp. SAG-AH-194-I05]
MKKIIFIILMSMLSINLFALDNSEMILKEIKQLRVDMNKRFEQVDKRFEQIDKRFEQVDKRFEQVDRRFEHVEKRFDFMQNILYMLMGLIFASPFIAIYLRDKREAEDKKHFENLKGILFVLREMAQDNEKIQRSLKAASLL